MSISQRILIVEDEQPVRNFLRISLRNRGYLVDEASSGAEGIRLTASNVPDLVLLDLGLPDIDGLEVIKNIRSWSSIPIIVLSARGQEQDKVSALETGADDYLTKPFSTGELFARINVAFRHSARIRGETGEPVARFSFHELDIDLEKHTVHRSGEQVHLTATEFKLLTLLVKNSGKVLTHNFILREIWGPASENRFEYLRVFMAVLRKKLEADPSQPAYILTEIGVGYRFSAD